MSKIEVNTVDAQCGSTVTIGSSGKNVKIEGNDIRSNDYKASDGGNIINQSGTTITLGASGDTINLASGASQTGFGRTGTVDWQTTPKTGDFTAANGEGYFINTTSGEITVTLPSASAGNIVSIQDYNNTFDSNSCIIQAPSGAKINGGTAAGKITLSTEGQGLTLVYVDGTVGWRSVDSTTFTDSSIIPTYITATGGSISTVCTNFKVHTFTGPGTFQVTAGAGPLAVVDYLIIAGGGGGGSSGGGGAGAGGYRESKVTATSGSWTASPLAATTSLPAPVASYPITVGAGGGTNPAPGSIGTVGNNGANSIFSTITSAGGGYGGARAPSIGPVTNGGPGGSGGGGSWDIPGTANFSVGGSGNTPPVSPPQGNDGSRGQHNGPTHSVPGGGGGAGGAAPTSGPGGGGPAGYGTGNGGNGVASSITSSPVTRAGGGGGCTSYGGNGGPGGGGNKKANGTANTGGGGGGGSCSCAGSGGSGVVIIRYRFQA